MPTATRTRRPATPTLLIPLRLVGALLTGTSARAALFDNDPPLDAFDPQGAPEGAVDPDHSDWSAFLQRHVVTDDPSGVNLVRYREVDAGERAVLDAYLQRLQAIAPMTLTRDAQMAYWINLYNALTVELILDNPDVDSIREIKSGRVSIGPWSREVAEVAGHTLTLNDIKNRILRPLFADPRIHFAVNCASIGCPDLAPEAWTADNLETLLEAGARGYINHPRGVRLDGDRRGERLQLSSIFGWYRGDFPDGRAAFLEWLAGYAEPELAQRLRGYDGRIRHAYDWSLNSAD